MSKLVTTTGTAILVKRTKDRLTFDLLALAETTDGQPSDATGTFREFYATGTVANQDVQERDRLAVSWDADSTPINRSRYRATRIIREGWPDGACCGGG